MNITTEDLRSFWRDCYRDAQKELVRAHGIEGLMLAPRIAGIASSLAQEAVKHYAKRLFPACKSCNATGFAPHADSSFPCNSCDGLGVAIPPELQAAVLQQGV